MPIQEPPPGSPANSLDVSIVVISKDEPVGLADTLGDLRVQSPPAREIIVVDASEGRLDAIRRANPLVRWIDFAGPPGTRITIPHQRNLGVASASCDVIAFADCGSRVGPG